MKNLKDMTIIEVLKELGIFITYNDLPNFIENTEKVDEIKLIISESKSEKEKSSKVIKFFKENEEYINMEKFILLQMYRINEKIQPDNSIFAQNRDLTKNINVSPEELQEKMYKARKLIEGSKRSAMVIDNQNKLNIVNIDTLSGKKQSDKNKKRLLEINEEVPLKYITAPLWMVDLENLISTDAEIGDYLTQYAEIRTLTKEKDIYGWSEKEIQDYSQTISFKKNLTEEMANVILEYYEYINVDKLLLASMYRQLKIIEQGNLDENIIKDGQELLKKEYKFVNEKTKLKGITEIVNVDEKNSYETEVSITAKELKRKIDNNFINGQYISDKTIQEIRNKIFNENVLLEIYEPRVIELLKMDSNDLMSLLENDDNFKYAIDFNIVENNETIKDILYNRKNISTDMIEYLQKKDKITNQDIFGLYLADIVTLENIRELKEKEDLHIEEIVQEKELIRLYKEFNENGESKEFNKYLPLFKELKVKDSDLENKKEIGQNLIEELDGDFEEEDLKKMYVLGMIPVETAIEWGGESITQDMFNEGVLKPIDAKRLYKENALNIEMIKQVLKSSSLSDEDKLTLICSTFDSEEDAKTRMELIQYLSVDENENKRNINKTENRRNFKEFEKNTSKNAYITDPCMRWRLISLLDSEYSQEVCKDGYIIFKLPNVKNGTVIVEKMFKKSKDGIIPSYGNATYILNEEEYLKNKNTIIDNNLKKGQTINLSELLELREQEKVDRLNHSSKWGNNIKEYFEIEKEETMYTKQQIEQIDKTIESIEHSRTLK